MNPEPKILTPVLAIAEEQELIRQAKADPRAFEPIYEAYFKTIFLFVVRRVGDKALAADITQQVFLKALLTIAKFEQRGLPFSAWLYRVAINEVNETFRRTKRERLVTLDNETMENLFEEITATSTIDALEEKLPLILQKLSPDDLMMIELRFFEKKSFKDVGQITGLSEINAKVRTYRILEKMKKMFLC